MELSIAVSGVKINKTGKEERHGLTGQCMKVITSWGRNTGTEVSNGLMVPSIRGSSYIITLKALVSISGLMEENTKACGRITKWMDVVYLPGLMVADMKENISKIKKKVLALSIGPIAGNMSASGPMESSMGEAHL